MSDHPSVPPGFTGIDVVNTVPVENVPEPGGLPPARVEREDDNIGEDVSQSTLRNVIEAYLLSKGFHRDKLGYWGHPELGESRTFENAVKWWMGVEEAGRD